MGSGQSSGRAASRDQHIRTRLGELLRALEQIESVLSVAAAALRHQNCEKDVDVARVLQRDAGDRLSVEIEKIEALLATFNTGSSTRRKSGNS